MAEAIVTFSVPAFWVMETVFKAAMYEITRLVEDRFLEEVTRSREQVDTLKRRLKWSESRLREREGDLRGRCVHCGRVGLSGEDSTGDTEKSLKGKLKESVAQEEMNSDEKMPRHGNEYEPESHTTAKATQTSCVQGEKFSSFKEEVLQCPAEASESQEWGVTLDEASGMPGPSKRFTDQKIPKCQMNWGTGFVQRQESSQDGLSGDPSGPLYPHRYGMEDLRSFDKSGYGDSGMTDVSHFDGLNGSPSHMGKDLSYVGHYDDALEAAERADHQAYHTGTSRSRKGSTSRTDIDASGEFSCLLINEEGYLQDPNVLYPEQVSGDSGSRLDFRDQVTCADPSVQSMGDLYGPSDAYSDTLNVGDRLQGQATGRGDRRHACNQCSMLFTDPAELKAHKQTHKSTGHGPPYYCKHCGKIFTQASNLRVHQRIHTGQGLHLCSRCGKDFPSFSNLKTHKCSPTGDKPYCCSVCGNKFSRLWNLKLHQRIHTQEKPHRCSMCDKSFTRADILKVHQRTHTGERPYCCTVCGLSFKRLDHLKSHQRKHMTDL
ncbi:uncharacterized protein KZ484_024745 [Pholidichthys leucotaenia]